MKTHLFFAMALVALQGASITVHAQSPWESGNFQGYNQPAPSAASPDQGNSGNGLEGFSLSPSPGAAPLPPAKPAPTKPAAASVSRASPSQSSTQSGAKPTAMSVSMDAASKTMIGEANDTTFVTMTQHAMDTVIQSSTLAQKKASPDMQKFAGQIASIYGGMKEEISAIAKKANIQPLTLALPNKLEKLEAASDSDFDRQYLKVEQQQFMLLKEAFKRQVKDGANPVLKAYAASHIDTLTQQSDMIQKSYAATRGQASASQPASNRSPLKQ